MALADKVIGASHWASYLINGDANGLEPRDKIAADRWLENNVATVHGTVVDVGEPFFTNHYGLHTGVWFSGGEVAEYTVLSE